MQSGFFHPYAGFFRLYRCKDLTKQGGPTMEDEFIIGLYWSRNESAIEETAKKYGSCIRAVALNILRNNEDSEEIENDTYVRTWNSIPPSRPRVLPGISHLTVWIIFRRKSGKAMYRSCSMSFKNVYPILGEVQKICLKRNSLQKY